MGQPAAGRPACWPAGWSAGFLELGRPVFGFFKSAGPVKKKNITSETGRVFGVRTFNNHFSISKDIRHFFSRGNNLSERNHSQDLKRSFCQHPKKLKTEEEKKRSDYYNYFRKFLKKIRMKLINSNDWLLKKFLISNTRPFDGFDLKFFFFKSRKTISRINK